MRRFVFLLTFLFINVGTHSPATAQASATLKEVMKLDINREGGANGANVAWHPVLKKYYAAMAGNETYPLVVFDAKGHALSNNDLETRFDIRGLWYNPTSKTLQMNGYATGGWAEYRLDAKGIPVSARNLPVTATQPDDQSVGAYDAKHNVLYYLDPAALGVERHNMKTGTADTTVYIKFGATSAKDVQDSYTDDMLSVYNSNAIIFTGIPKSEIGLLNYANKKIELYNVATGFMTKLLTLPEDAPVQGSLNFSYCNGIYWLFDKAGRMWHGYK